MTSITQLQQHTEATLQTLLKLGVSDAEITLAQDYQQAFSVRAGKMAQSKSHRDQLMHIKLYQGKRSASLSLPLIDQARLRGYLAEALSSLEFLPEDYATGLADADLLAWEQSEDESLTYHPFLYEIEDVFHLAAKLEQKALGMDSRIGVGDGVLIEQSQTTTLYANTHQFFAHRLSTSYGASLHVLASAEGKQEGGYAWRYGTTPYIFEDWKKLADEATDEATRSLSPSVPKTAQLTLLMTPEAAQKFYRAFAKANHGELLSGNRSILNGKLGKLVYSDSIHVLELPHIPELVGSRLYDQSGVATYPKNVVHRGVLESHFTDSRSACRLRMPNTGNAGGISNLYFYDNRARNTGLEALLADVKDGVLVTDWLGSGIDMLTGEVSIGAKGCRIEGGKRGESLNNFTVSGDLGTILRTMVVGSDCDYRFPILGGSAMVPKVQIAGA